MFSLDQLAIGQKAIITAIEESENGILDKIKKQIKIESS